MPDHPPDHPPELPAVTVLLASYNGAPHIGAQMASIAAQDHDRWALWVSDDSSDDDTCAQVKAFARAHPDHDIRLLEGPRRGAAANFLSLLCHPDLLEGCVAICDQDDVWYPHKLRAGLQALHEARGPAVWSAQSRHVDSDGRPIGASRVHRGVPSFGNALVQNRVAGHCATLNAQALALVRAAGPVEVPFHDWWLYQLITGAGGQVIISPEPVLDYRQHSDNVLGGNQRRWAALLRAAMVLGPTFGRWTRANWAALETALPLLSPEARATLAALGSAPPFGPGRARVMARAGIIRDQRRATALLRLAALLGRV